MFLRDRCADTSTTTGTGTFTISGTPLTGYKDLPTDQVFPYLIEAVDENGAPTGEWETGLGSITGTTLTRNLETSSGYGGDSFDGTVPVDFGSGTKRAWFCLNAAAATQPWVAEGTLGSAQGPVDTTTAVEVAIDTLSHQNVEFAEIHSNGVRSLQSPSPWVKRFMVHVEVELEDTTADEWVLLTIREAGNFVAQTTHIIKDTFAQFLQMSTVGPLVIFSGTAEVTVHVQTETSTAVTIASAKVILSALVD